MYVEGLCALPSLSRVSVRYVNGTDIHSLIQAWLTAGGW